MKLKQLILLGTTSILVTTSSLATYAAKNQPQSLALNQSQTIVAQRTVDQGTTTMMSGNFVSAEKPTKGTARIINEGGLRYLELDDSFSASTDGPDLHILLSSQSKPPKSYDNLGGVINLGKLKDYSGKQRYLISSMIDVSKIKSVVIWCQTANATFGYAPVTIVR